MKGLLGFAFLILLIGCQQEQEIVSDLTGNEVTYELTQASEYSINGTVSFQERRDGFTNVVVQLQGTDGDVKHPVHLHLGTLATPQADVAALLSPVIAETGTSETILKFLADETPVTYRDVIQLNACIKVHLSDTGDGRDIILAGGDIGESYVSSLASGRQRNIAVCKSN